MKRSISLLLALVMALSLLPAVHADSGPAVSSNINDHFYINAYRWTDPIKSTLAAEDGGYLRVEYIDDRIVVEHYDAKLNYVSGQELAGELPVYGGVYICDDYNFVVTGQNNTEEDDSKEVFRITRYDKDWNRLDHASLFGANTVYPFEAGCVRFDRSGDILYIRTSHEMYTTSDGYNHQANVMIAVRISDMTVTDSLTKIWNSDYGYVSHSFNQFVRVDGDTLLAVDHGDALPRSVVLFKYSKKAGEETFYGRTTMVNALNIVDSTYHYNDTGVSVGGFECSSTDYLIAGCSYDQIESANLMNVHRNIFVTATPKDDFTDEATTVNWLTSYTAADGVTVSPPHLLKLDTDRFFLTWTENGTLKYCFLNGQGQLDGQIVTGSGDLSDCEPIRSGRYILWYVTDNSAPVFYQIELEPCDHSYASAVTDPTCTEGGYTTYTCTECGDSYVGDRTAALGHDYGAWYTVREATCTEPGTRRRDCARCSASEDASIPATDHSYESTVTDPTCTESGYTTYTCIECGDSYVGERTAALGHDYGAWYTVRDATCTEPGTRRRDCTRCSASEDSSIPAVGHSYEKIVTAPTCTEQGYTTHTCARCQDSYTDTYSAALGHDWDEGVVITEPTQEENGLLRCTCLRCGATEDRVIPALGHTHAYESVVTEPTCTEQGFTTHTCACGDRYVDSYTAALGHDWKGLACKRCDATRQNPFTDTDPEGFYFESVLWAVDNGITTGTSPTTFDPLGQCQRAQVVTFLWRAAGKPEPTSTDNPFVDVTEDDFYCKAVLWAVEQGITNGLDATHFGPYAYCNRAQVVTFLWRRVGSPEVRNANNPFADVKAGEFYYDAVLWAVENGITNGLSATEFGVGAICNRAQIVTFLYRTFA